MRKLKDDKKISWTEAYTDKTQFFKDMYEDIIGPKSYYRFEGNEIDGDGQWVCVVSPSGIKKHEKKWFAGIRKLPSTWPSSGKKFDSINQAFSYANETWGTPIPKNVTHYTMNDLKEIATRESEWRENREEEEKLEKNSSSHLDVKTAMAKAAHVKGGLALHINSIKDLVGKESTYGRLGNIIFNGNKLSDEEKVSLASDFAVDLRKKLMFAAAKVVESRGVVKIDGNISEEEVSKNIKIISDYKDYLKSINVSEKSSVPIQSNTIEDCMTWTPKVKTERAATNLTENGKAMRQVLVDFFSKYQNSYPKNISDDAKENIVLSSTDANDVLMLISAISTVDHIVKTKTFASQSSADNKSKIMKDFSSLASMSQVERSMAWIIQHEMREKDKYERRMEEAGVLDTDTSIPIDMFLELCRTEDKARSIVVGPYMSDLDFQKLKSIKLDEASCSFLSDGNEYLKNEMIKFLGSQEIFNKECVFNKQFVDFAKEFLGANNDIDARSMLSRFMFEDIPLAKSKDGVKSIRAKSGAHKRRIFESIGSWYFGRRAMQKNDPIDNPLLSDLLLEPKMAVAHMLIEQCREKGLTDVVNKMTEDYKGIPRSFISIKEFSKYYNGNDASSIFSIASDFTDNIVPTLQQDGISPSVSFTKRGALIAMRHVLGSRWSLGETSKEIYKEFLMDVVNSCCNMAVVQNLVKECNNKGLTEVADKISKDYKDVKPPLMSFEDFSKYYNGSDASSMFSIGINEIKMKCQQLNDIKLLEQQADRWLNATKEVKKPSEAINHCNFFSRKSDTISSRKFNDTLHDVYGKTIIYAKLDEKRSDMIGGDSKSEATNRLLSSNKANDKLTVSLKSTYKISPNDIPLSSNEIPDINTSVIFNGRKRSRLLSDMKVLDDNHLNVYFESPEGSFYRVKKSDLSMKIKKCLNEIDASFESTDSSFRISNYDPAVGSANKFETVQGGQKNVDSDGEPIIDRAIVGDLSYKDFLTSIASGWYGESPIKMSRDESTGEPKFNFIYDESSLNSYGTRDIWANRDSLTHQQVSKIIESIGDAKEIVNDILVEVSKTGKFWWRDAQPEQEVSRKIGRSLQKKSFPLVRFMNLSPSKDSDMIDFMSNGMGFKNEYEQFKSEYKKDLKENVIHNPSYSNIMSAIELTRDSASKYAASKIIMEDMKNGMINQILTQQFLEKIGKTVSEVEKSIPGVSEEVEDVADEMSKTMTYIEEVDSIEVSKEDLIEVEEDENDSDEEIEEQSAVDSAPTLETDSKESVDEKTTEVEEEKITEVEEEKKTEVEEEMSISDIPEPEAIGEVDLKEEVEKSPEPISPVDLNDDEKIDEKKKEDSSAMQPNVPAIKSNEEEIVKDVQSPSQLTTNVVKESPASIANPLFNMYKSKSENKPTIESPKINEVKVEQQAPTVVESPKIDEVKVEQQAPTVVESPKIDEVKVEQQTPTVVTKKPEQSKSPLYDKFKSKSKQSSSNEIKFEEMSEKAKISRSIEISGIIKKSISMMSEASNKLAKRGKKSASIEITKIIDKLTKRKNVK